MEKDGILLSRSNTAECDERVQREWQVTLERGTDWSQVVQGRNRCSPHLSPHRSLVCATNQG